ncbi:MAG: tRNA pseudouridine(55) synthase TruB [Kiritimatiellae bacterium]|nr:tRNA pseudouridine(55) synthase TruB [Kiritimatiellia bacterium]
MKKLKSYNESRDGVLLVDKPVGCTSHDIVNGIRRKYQLKKVGHGGTLDPNATGLLMMLLGKGTKLSSQIMGGDKTYTGVMHLGIVTSSQDCDGEILEENPWEHITREQVEAQFKELTGDIFQTPPMVSAIKVNGVPLYKLARKGQEVERKQRFVHIFRFKLTDWQPPLVSFEVICTKGTYVRTLAHDVGQTLGCGASLDVLRRTHSGDFDVSGAITYEDLQELSLSQLNERILPYERYAVQIR